MSKYQLKVTFENDLPDDIEARMWARNLEEFISFDQSLDKLLSGALLNIKLQKVFTDKSPEHLALR